MRKLWTELLLLYLPFGHFSPDESSYTDGDYRGNWTFSHLDDKQSSVVDCKHANFSQTKHLYAKSKVNKRQSQLIKT